jgi:hypothetical protein
MDLLDLPIIQVALGIIISWALFAIFISFIQESIAQAMAERGRFMKRYMLRQLYDAPNGINWANLVYIHGAVDMLIRANNKPTNDIHPKLFAEVLIDVVGSSNVVEVAKRSQDAGFLEKPALYQSQVIENFQLAIHQLKQSDTTAFLRLAWRNAELKAWETEKQVSESVIYTELVSQVQNWYIEFSERMTLWYKKRVRLKLFIIGLIVSIIINVDSIQLYKSYKIQPQSIQAVKEYYETYYAADTAKLNSDLKLNPGKSLDSLVKAAALPVGFDYNVFKKPPYKSEWIWKILGFLLTGFAASFGGPFWFDVLKKAYSQKVKIS